MSTIITEVYDAFKAAGTPEREARAAAQALAEYQHRFDKIEHELALIRKDIQALAANLRNEMELRSKELEARINTRFNEIDAKFAMVDVRFTEIDGRFNEIDGRFNELRKYTDGRFNELRKEIDVRFTEIDGRFNELRKEIDGRFTELRKDMEAMQSTLTIRLGGIMAAGIGIVSLLVKML